MHKLLVLALAAAFAAPPEATRDLSAADRLAAANDAAARRATAIVEKSSIACIEASRAPASVAKELVWLPVKFELRVATCSQCRATSGSPASSRAGARRD